MAIEPRGIMFYNLEYEGDLLVDDCATIAEVEAAADKWFDEKHPDLANGVTVTDVVDIIAYDDNYNELSRFKRTVSTEGYHGDIVEHGTWG